MSVSVTAVMLRARDSRACKEQAPAPYDAAGPRSRLTAQLCTRLLDANPNSFRKLVATFLEANGRGYWDASEDQIDRLRQLYMDVEDKIEGVE